MKYTILLILVIFTRSIFAQISIDAISTDTINIFNQQQQQKNRTPTGISWISLLLPGSGHQYVGSRKKALGYITLDLFALTGVIFFKQYNNRLISNYKSYAAQNANISTPVSDDYYWQIIGSFDSYYDYQETLDLVRESERKFTEQQFFWRWNDTMLRDEYISFQKVAKRFNTISSFFIGAMILNRIVAFIDLRTILKNDRFQNSSLSFKPITLTPSANGVALETTF